MYYSKHKLYFKILGLVLVEISVYFSFIRFYFFSIVSSPNSYNKYLWKYSVHGDLYNPYSVWKKHQFPIGLATRSLESH